MKNGGRMLQFTGLSDHGGLAIALHLVGRDAQGLNAALSQKAAKLIADIYKV